MSGRRPSADGKAIANNEAAEDLWSQIFRRQASHPSAAIMDPDHDHARDEERLRAGFLNAGWAEKEIENLIFAGRTSRVGVSSSTNPGVHPDAVVLYERLCNDIESEMVRQNLRSQQSVARGIEPKVGPFASKIGVMMTDQSIVTVGSFTFRFCGLIARAVLRTLNNDPFSWDRENYSPDRSRHLIERSQDLLMYWFRIYSSFALTGTHILTEFRPCTKLELNHMEQIARAMELFVVGHEYGHHHLKHGRDMEADPRNDEFQADQFSLRLCRPLGHREHPIWNPYLASGAGGVIILKALETLRRFEIKFGDAINNAGTHPSADERISRFDSVAALIPKEFIVLKNFRIASLRIMDAVDDLMADVLARAPKPLIDTLADLRSQALADRLE